ncbi:MAG: hypothetical protein Q7U66_04575 [Methylobacter sp.]|nr:hypothetical protein [Methylobacter sp.]
MIGSPAHQALLNQLFDELWLQFATLEDMVAGVISKRYDESLLPVAHLQFEKIELTLEQIEAVALSEDYPELNVKVLTHIFDQGLRIKIPDDCDDRLKLFNGLTLQIENASNTLAGILSEKFKYDRKSFLYQLIEQIELTIKAFQLSVAPPEELVTVDDFLSDEQDLHHNNVIGLFDGVDKPGGER